MMRSRDQAAQDPIWQEIEDALGAYEGPHGYESPSEILVGAGRKRSPV